MLSRPLAIPRLMFSCQYPISVLYPSLGIRSLHRSYVPWSKDQLSKLAISHTALLTRLNHFGLHALASLYSFNDVGACRILFTQAKALPYADIISLFQQPAT